MIKQIINNKKLATPKCLKCSTPITDQLYDDLDYICPCCGRRMLVDAYPKQTVLTAAEYPELRRRHSDYPLTAFKIRRSEAAKKHDEWLNGKLKKV